MLLKNKNSEDEAKFADTANHAGTATERGRGGETEELTRNHLEDRNTRGQCIREGETTNNQ